MWLLEKFDEKIIIGRRQFIGEFNIKPLIRILSDRS